MKIITQPDNTNKIVRQETVRKTRASLSPEIYREEPYDEDNLLFTIGKPPSGTCWILIITADNIASIIQRSNRQAQTFSRDKGAPGRPSDPKSYR